MTREEIVKALRCCNSETECRGCTFEEQEPLLGPCAEKVLSAAADMLEQDVPPTDMVPKDFHDRCMEMEIERRISQEGMHKKAVDEICELKDRVQNLTLYLQDVFDTDIQLYDWLDKRHPGLPGYAPKKWQEVQL